MTTVFGNMSIRLVKLNVNQTVSSVNQALVDISQLARGVFADTSNFLGPSVTNHRIQALCNNPYDWYNSLVVALFHFVVTNTEQQA